MERKSRLPVRSNSFHQDIRRASVERLNIPASAHRSVKRSKTVARGYSQSRMITPDARHIQLPGSGYRTKSPIYKKDDRPLSDPKWQQEQLKLFTVWLFQILQFVQRMEPNIKTLKPLTINSFVTVCYLLFYTIDEAFLVTMENYKIKIPELLKILEYPSKIPVSLMKCPNTMHAFPNILAIWSFLLDYIKLLQNSNNLVLKCSSQLQQVAAKCLVRKYVDHFDQYQKKQLLDDNGQSFFDELCNIYGNDPKEIDRIKNNITNMRSEHSAITKSNTKLESRMQDDLSQIKKYERIIDDHEQKNAAFFKNCKAKLKDLQSCDTKLGDLIKEKSERLLDLTEKLSKVGHSKEEVEELVKSLESQTHKLKLLRDRKIHSMETLSGLDLQLASNKMEIESLVYKINNDISDCVHLFSPGSDLFIPESGFAGPDFAKTIEAKLVDDVFEKKLEELENLLRDQLAQEEQEKQECIVALEMHKNHEGLLATKLTIMERENMIIAALKKQIDDNTKEIDSLNIELREVRESATDLTEFENLKQQSIERLNYVKDFQEVQRLKISEFFKEIHITLLEALCKETELFNRITASMNVKRKELIVYEKNLSELVSEFTMELKEFREKFEEHQNVLE